MMYSDIRYLSVPLPEDIEKLKWFGDFDRLERVIGLRLKKDLPGALRARLLLEREIARTLPKDYPLDTQAALAQLRGAIRDFKDEELETLRDENAADWIYVNGVVHYRDNVLDNLVKTRPDLEARMFDQAGAVQTRKNRELLDGIAREMMEKGEVKKRIRILTEMTIAPEAVRKGRLLRVHLPLPVEGRMTSETRVIKTFPEGAHIADARYPQRTAYFEARAEEGQKFSVEYEYLNRARYVKLDPERAQAYQPNFYTQEEEPHIRFTPYLRSLAAEILGGEMNPVRRARRIYDYVTTKPVYSFVRHYLAIADLPGYMATGFKGDCGIFSLLFITLMRIAGIPARWQSGLFAAPFDVGSHDWAQFYIAPYGWLYADCSFGNSAFEAGSALRHDFYFGNLDPFRMPAAEAFQFPFDPPKAFLRIDPYDNQSGEAEYEDMGLLAGAFETKHTLLSMEDVQEG